MLGMPSQPQERHPHAGGLTVPLESQPKLTGLTRSRIPALEPRSGQPAPDPVEQADVESFPASDPPARSTKDVQRTSAAPHLAATKPPVAPPTAEPPQLDRVDEASEQSFPASDPPAWGSSHV
jgi:hypothetical protein